MDRVLVTGTHGIVGRWVTKKLREEGSTVIGVDRKDEPADVDEHYTCNILNRERLTNIVQEASPDALVHLAARTDLDETESLDGYAANIDGVRNIVDAVRASSSVRRAVYTSSQLVCRIGYVPESDTDYCPDTLYGESKVQTERIVRDEKGGGVPWCIVRPTTVWGPHMKPHYQKMIRYIEKGLYFHVGYDDLYKSYSYAGNIAHQYYKILTVPGGDINERTLYLADYEPLSLRKYTDKIQEELGVRPIPTCPLPVARLLAKAGDLLNWIGWEGFPFNSFRLRNILTEYIYDMEETKRICGPLPYSFDKGVKETVKWYISEKDNL